MRKKTPLNIDTALYSILKQVYCDEVGVMPKKCDLEQEITELLINYLEELDASGKIPVLTSMSLERYLDKHYED